jgi:DNA repair protein RadA/Sms
LGTQDVYINVIGGLRINETAADLPIALAVYSSFRDMSMDSRMVVMGEVGLTGDIRRVPQALRRVKEGAKMGFNQFIIPKGNMEDVDAAAFPSCRIIPAGTLKEAVLAAFKQ